MTLLEIKDEKTIMQKLHFGQYYIPPQKLDLQGSVCGLRIRIIFYRFRSRVTQIDRIRIRNTALNHEKDLLNWGDRCTLELFTNRSSFAMKMICGELDRVF